MTDETHGDSGMGEGTAQGGEENPLHGQGGEGREKEAATQPIGDDDQIQGQTQHDAPNSDVGSQRGGDDRPGA